MEKIRYITAMYPFAKKLCEVFGVKDLSIIQNDIPLLKRETDQATVHHHQFYEWTEGDDFKDMYENFIEVCVRPLYLGSIVVQTNPTFRIAYPNNIAVGEFHKDKNYRDPAWAAQVKEVNYFLPFTDAFGTNTFWAESEEDKGDFAPVECDYGYYVRWDGANLTHGNKVNDTGKTRISVDFRVCEKKNFVPLAQGSINTGKKFDIGGYYKLYD
jgi:hypothetical protein